MLQQGVILPSQSPWAATSIMVKKKKKDWASQFCIDFSGQNNKIIMDAHPLPLFGE